MLRPEPFEIKITNEELRWYARQRDTWLETCLAEKPELLAQDWTEDARKKTLTDLMSYGSTGAVKIAYAWNELTLYAKGLHDKHGEVTVWCKPLILGGPGGKAG
eukprot:2540067-Amphidinium_carterae.1